MSVPILKYGGALVASVQTELTDSDWADLRDRMLRQAAVERTKAALIDVTGMDVLDSFAGRALNNMADMLRLRGVETVVVGIQPEVAFSMVQLGLRLEGVKTALDLEEGAQCVRKIVAKGGRRVP